jgi:sRNA-binding regulator protein Hfq
MDKQTITGDGGTGYTLDHAVGSEQEIEVFVNNVRQEPGSGKAYTVSGTTLTMTGNVASTDDFYVVFQGKAQQSVTHPSSSALQATTGTFSGALSATTGTFTGDVSTTGDFKPTGKEYFHVDLTTAQTGNALGSTVTVDFGGSGTVKYDTKSNFDSANDAYLLDSSDGLYLISFSVGIRSNNITSEVIKDAAAQVRVATDGSTFTPIIGGGGHLQNDANNEFGSLSFSGSFIYKATTSTTKIDVQAFSNNSGTAEYIISQHVDNLVDVAPTGSGTARCTFLSIARIA